MNKKIVCLALALMLLMTGVVYAAVGPSKQTGDLTQNTVTASNGTVLPPDFSMNTAGQTAFSAKVFDELAAFVADGTKSIVEYFPVDVVSDITSAIAASGITGVAAGDLQINEFMPLGVLNYAPEYGELKVKFDFPTQYQLGQAVVAVVGISGAGETEWTVAPTRVTVTGSLEITFSEELMTQLGSSDAVLAVLSGPAA